MTSRVVCTLDPHRLGPGLVLGRGNLDVTTTDACDFARAVFGTVAIGAGRAAFNCYVWSKTRPAAGLVNLVSVGIAQTDEVIDNFVGSSVISYGFRPADAAVWNRHDISTGVASPALQPTPERMCIGVMLDMTAALVAWYVNGSLIFQTSVDASKFYVPAVSIGSDSPGDITASFNFGQSLLDFPKFPILE